MYLLGFLQVPNTTITLYAPPQNFPLLYQSLVPSLPVNVSVSALSLSCLTKTHRIASHDHVDGGFAGLVGWAVIAVIGVCGVEG